MSKPEGEAGARLDELVRRLDSILRRLETSQVPSREELQEVLEEVREEVEELARARERGAEVVDRDVLELKGVLDVVTPFLERLGGILREVLSAVVEELNKFLDGRKLGEDIGSLYITLKSMGLPEEDVREMVREYYRRRLEAIPPLAELLRQALSMVRWEGRGAEGAGSRSTKSEERA